MWILHLNLKPTILILDSDSIIHIEEIQEKIPSANVDETKVLEDNKWPTRFWTQYKALAYRNFMESKERFLAKPVLLSVSIFVKQ